jgi:hypothetical protein
VKPRVVTVAVDAATVTRGAAAAAWRPQLRVRNLAYGDTAINFIQFDDNKAQLSLSSTTAGAIVVGVGGAALALEGSETPLTMSTLAPGT